MKKSLPLIALFISFVSCERIVDIDLHDGHQQLVVNAQLAADNDTLSMQLSTTGRFTDGAGIGPAGNAVISITDQNGNTAQFSEATPGQYLLANYNLTTGNTYTLTATNEIGTIEATSTVAAKAVIDSIRYEVIQYAGFEYTIVHVYTMDPSPEANYFRSLLSYDSQGFHRSSNVIADVLSVNGLMDVALISEPFVQGDTVTVELWSMDEAGYQFYRTLHQAANSDPSSTASPFNVTSNVMGGLGLFEVYQRDDYTLVVN